MSPPVVLSEDKNEISEDFSLASVYYGITFPIVVVTGFMSLTKDGVPTTLNQLVSKYSAVYVRKIFKPDSRVPSSRDIWCPSTISWDLISLKCIISCNFLINYLKLFSYEPCLPRVVLTGGAVIMACLLTYFR